MAIKTFSFSAETLRNQQHEINIPKLKEIVSADANTGNVTHSSSGEMVILNFSNGQGQRVQVGGSYTPADTKFVTAQTSQHYNSGGYVGTLEQYLYSGAYTPVQSKIVSANGQWTSTLTKTSSGFTTSKNEPQTYAYNSDGYAGTLSLKDSTPVNSTWFNNQVSSWLSNSPSIGATLTLKTHDVTYQGSVNKAAQDTRIYRYQGYVTKPAVDTRTYATYYTYSVTVNYTERGVPCISGDDGSLGAKADAFDLVYQVTEPDGDTVTITEKLNGEVLRTINNAPLEESLTIAISREQLYSMELEQTNTIEIKADDGKDGIVFRRYTFQRTNSAPQIDGEDLDLGEKNEPFSVNFSALDAENDDMNAKIYLNNQLLKSIDSLASGQIYSFEISKLDFIKLNGNEMNNIRIEVQDSNDATSIRNLTFIRSVEKIEYVFVKETDAMATQILITPTWHVAEGAEGKVWVCNNVYDDVPTWEDATIVSLQGTHFNFNNETKTAATWGIGVKISIEKRTATELSWLAGFGGAYK